MESIDFSSLIEAVASNRDRAAFAVLFGHFAPRVKAYMLRFSASAAGAEELAQETLLMVWRKAATYDRSRASAAAWIFAIARNLRIDSLRQQRCGLIELDPGAESDPPEQPDFPITAMERDSRLRDALRRLPEEQVCVIELSFFDERPHGDIAAYLGIPLGTVKSRLRLAMGKLRELLGDLL